VHRPLNPRLVNVAVDTNALQDDPSRQAHVDRFVDLALAFEFIVTIPHTVLKELDRPSTPPKAKQLATQLLHTLPVDLTADERQMIEEIERELQGNAKPGRHTADARHLFESAKYGGYFVTYDERIKKRAGPIAKLPPSLTVVDIEEFLSIFDGTPHLSG